MMTIGQRRYPTGLDKKFFRVLDTTDAAKACEKHAVPDEVYRKARGRVFRVREVHNGVTWDNQSVCTSDTPVGGWWFPLVAVEFCDSPIPAPNYHVGKDKPGVNYHAGQLLESLRPEVEKILDAIAERYPEQLPSCTSQSLRASAAARLLRSANEKNRTSTEDASLRFVRFLDINSRLTPLEAFLAVHRTVTIMESKSNDI